MAYTQRSGRCDRKVVEVQLLSWAQKLNNMQFFTQETSQLLGLREELKTAAIFHYQVESRGAGCEKFRQKFICSQLLSWAQIAF